MQGLSGKMSASDPNSAIFLNDKPNDIKKKINSFAFSGGGATLKEHQEKGANLEVDIPYQYLRFFLESDERLEEIRFLIYENKNIFVFLQSEIWKRRDADK